MKKIKKTLTLVAAMFMILASIAPMHVHASVKLSETRKTLSVGQSFVLEVTGTSKKIKWSSEYSWIASVNKYGKVTAKDIGTTTIYAKTGKKTLKCKVTVKYPEIKVQRKEVYTDKNISVSFDGIKGDEDGYNINLYVENFTGRALEIYASEVSINGYMVDPTCYMEISPRKKIVDEISVEYSDAERVPIKEIRNIEVKFHVFDESDDDFSYDTRYIAMMGISTKPQEPEEKVLGFDKDEAEKNLSVSAFMVKEGAIATIKSTYGANIEMDLNYAFYDSSGKLIDSQNDIEVQVAKERTAISHVRTERKDASKIKVVVSDVRKGDVKNHPEKINITGKNYSFGKISAQVNNTGNQNMESVVLTCVFLKDSKPVGYSTEYMNSIQKYSHGFVTFEVPEYETYVRDEYGDYDWEYVRLDCNKYIIFVDRACYE